MPAGGARISDIAAFFFKVGAFSFGGALASAGAIFLPSVVLIGILPMLERIQCITWMRGLRKKALVLP